MNIKIKYDGQYPNLCSGLLVVTIDGNEWEFPPFCLTSGGSVSFDNDWNANIESGEWTVCDWPEGFPNDKKTEVAYAINEEIPSGCCGGCI